MATDHECNFIFEERVKYRIECLEAANRAQKEEMDKMKAKIDSLNDIKYKEIESVKKQIRILLSKFVQELKIQD